MTGCWMNNHARRLVDDNHVVIFVNDNKRDIFGNDVRVLGRRDTHLVRLTRFDPVVRLSYGPRAVTDLAIANERLHARAAEFGVRSRKPARKPAIEALTGIVRLHLFCDNTGRLIFDWRWQCVQDFFRVTISNRFQGAVP